MQWHSILGLVVFCLPVVAQTFYSDPWHSRSIIGENNLQAIEDVQSTEFYEMSKIVARMGDHGAGGWCSSFRVGKDLFLTNHHCRKDCSGVSFVMGYEKAKPNADKRYFDCDAEVLSNLHVDFALYRAHPRNPNQADTYPVAILSPHEIADGESLILPSHAATMPKQIDVSDSCRVISGKPFDHFDRVNITHACDTMGGSSGSPLVKRSNGVVIGVHWGGVGDGSNYNHAIPMHEVLKYIRETAPGVYQELTVD